MSASAHRSRDELSAALPEILAAPKEEGRLELIVVRPESGARRTPQTVRLTATGGVEGDHWAAGCWLETEDGRPHPDVQICLMMARCIAAIAGPVEHWPPAGDNLFIDMDLTPANTPPGTRLAIGSTELLVTAEPHNGCQSFANRFGHDACVFVNTGPGRLHRLRGVYCRVVKDGDIARGDVVKKLS